MKYVIVFSENGNIWEPLGCWVSHVGTAIEGAADCLKRNPGVMVQVEDQRGAIVWSSH